MHLTNNKLNGLNFQQWSHVMKIALCTRIKLRFKNETCTKPALNSPHYEQWIRCESMVVGCQISFIRVCHEHSYLLFLLRNYRMNEQRDLVKIMDPCYIRYKMRLRIYVKEITMWLFTTPN